MIKKILATVIEVAPDSASLLVRPGVLQSGRELAAALSEQGRAVKFLRWPGGNTVAVTYPATQEKPSINQYAQAYRLSLPSATGSSVA